MLQIVGEPPGWVGQDSQLRGGIGVMYRLVRGHCTMQTDSAMLARYLDPSTHALDRDGLVRSVFQRTYDGYFGAQVGRFLALKAIHPVRIRSSSVQMGLVSIEAQYQAYFYRAQERGLVDVVVKQVSPRGVVATVLGYPVEIGQDGLYAGLHPEYDASTNALVFANQRVIHVGDVLRARIGGLIRGYGITDAYRLRASCTHPGCGKRE